MNGYSYTTPPEGHITSLQVAEVTGMRHKSALRSIRNHCCSYWDDYYLDRQGKSHIKLLLKIEDAMEYASKLSEPHKTPLLRFLGIEDKPIEEYVKPAVDDFIPIGMDFNGRMMSSMYLAQELNIPHKKVMADIRKALGGNIREENFHLSSCQYQIPNGGVKTIPCYEMNQKGCLLVITGYRADLREKIIDRWLALETRQATPIVPLTQAQILLQSAQMLVDLEQKTNEHDNRIGAIEQKFQELENRKKQAELELFTSDLSENDVPTVSLRKKINSLVAHYAEQKGIDYNVAWRYLYQGMDEHYHVRFHEDKERNYRKIDDAEKRGLLPQMFDLISLFIKELNNEYCTKA